MPWPTFRAVSKPAFGSHRGKDYTEATKRTRIDAIAFDKPMHLEIKKVSQSGSCGVSGGVARMFGNPLLSLLPVGR